MKTCHIKETPHGSRLCATELFNAWHLDVPLSPTELQELLRKAITTSDMHPRVDSNHVAIDRTPEGVRVHVVKNTTWFDIPWHILVKDLIQ
ncbi:hypothetical protein [Ruegeria arenilitoris]|uniref:hypothetical protein n=1 Tax=Ruegeria arenilitoris TaxID=1173585 RepID=UPI00147AD07B|nr:hypothetical protein [Ruegeria arenilitoris]